MRMTTRTTARLLAAALAATLMAAAAGAAPAAAATSSGARAADPPLPGSIAAIGDSISQAFDVCCIYGNHPGHSWTTGYVSGDGIASHYERIQAADPGIAGHEYDDAVFGSVMADAPGQAQEAVAQGAQYVTILMGANDLCTSSPGTMTSPTAFRTSFEQTMSILESGLPAGAHVFVASIPNIYLLWKVLHRNLLAQAVWAAAQICQSMLSTSDTSADRQAVVNREHTFNTILASVCGAYPNCRFDGGAVYRYQFAASQVSTLDYFHPNLSGQAALAATTWAASWWPTTP